MDGDLKYQQWAHVYDNARYLGVEFRYKEREYGIKWRKAFIEELELKANYLTEKYEYKPETGAV